MSHPPRSTYRVQLHPGFTFDDATAVVDYLARLGVSHLYASPVLQAAPGSTHGYDVVDHARLSAELGGRAAFDRLSAALAERGMGLVVDVVPNHMATDRTNTWWWDVLENGPSSRYASYFDIDWRPPEEKLRNTVLVPVLGDHYGRVLERGEIALRRDGGSVIVAYYDNELPVSPRTLAEPLAEVADRLGSDELASLAAAFGHLPHAEATDRASVVERHRDKEMLSKRLGDLCAEQPEVASAVDAELAAVSADADRLDALLSRQNFRLAYWRVAGQELDYRRFFDIPTLIGLRAEDQAVFDDSHELLVDLVARGGVDGLRIDHPDGLRDPAGYLRRLRQAAPAWVVVEKILHPGEFLRGDWDAAGTTGYDFLNVLGGLFVDPAGAEPLTELYGRVTGDRSSFGETALAAKREVMDTSLGADVERLTGLFAAVCEARRRHRDYTRVDLRTALSETLAGFDIYRTYVPPGGPPAPEDVRAVSAAVDRVRARRPDLDETLLRLLEDILLGRDAAPDAVELAQRFQQTCGPVMAKGVEDTAFYRWVRLVSLNEVGGEPTRFGVSLDAFHAFNETNAARWPATMLTTSTHDTKRSEDVRARMALLSEQPARWAAAVDRWMAVNGRFLTDGMPDRRTQYLLYQTMVGAHPIDGDRLSAFALKAVREAKLHTSWTDQDPEYESAVVNFVTGLAGDAAFSAELAAFVAPMVDPGRVTALAQKLLALTSPGVPDTYQGSEVWDLSLVDPDNRRPVDFASLADLLDRLDGATPEEILTGADEGWPKLAVTAGALRTRRDRPQAFTPGATYRPLAASGAHAHRVVAFARGDEVITVAPRLVGGLEAGWADTTLELPAGAWTDVFTGATWQDNPELAALLGRFPVGLLVRS